MAKKKRVIVILVAAFLLIIGALLAIYPTVEFKCADKFYALRYTDDFSEFDENASYNELYFYNEENDVSVRNVEVKNFLFFYVFSFDYVEGDYREKEFKLEDDFMQYWLKNAEIQENPANIDVAKLIKGKTPLEGNKKYPGNEFDKMIVYKLDGNEDIMYYYQSDDLTVFQFGSTDESPKYIAYK